ncbi:MAG: hypothetical protein II135_10530, partial [Clostridia bacterium]|nr:hypothetical protein [Clostridia bacterium]
VVNPVPTLVVYKGDADLLKRFEKYSGYSNPSTADASVYITAGAGLIALLGAVICKKKIKE